MTDESMEGWDRFATSRGANNKTALIEIIGRHLHELPDDLPPPWPEWIAEAKAHAETVKSRKRMTER